VHPLVERLKASLAGRREEIRALHARGTPGRVVASALCDAVDEVVVGTAEAMSVATEGLAVAVAALGGYGRGLLNPGSDVDLLFVSENGRSLPQEAVGEYLRLLWDIGFELGHASRTFGECVQLGRNEHQAFTAMLDARFLAGEPEVFARFERTFRRGVARGNERALIAAIARNRELRHAQYQGRVGLLEPNVKEGPGGLRDVHDLRWANLIVGHRPSQDGAEHDGLLSPNQEKALDAAYDVLLRARNELHFCANRKQDVLDHALQAPMAAGLGYQDSDVGRAVEQFMQGYYLAAHQIKRLTDVALRTLLAEQRRSWWLLDRVRQRALASGFVLRGRSLGLPSRGRDGFFKADPLRLLSVFAEQQRLSVELDASCEAAITEHLGLIDANFRASPEGRRIFFRILGADRNVAAALRHMHELGVLGAYLPEFGALSSLVQHDRYHAYTVDDHTLRAVEHLETLTRRMSVSPTPEENVVTELEHPQVLYLAVLLHDVGKPFRRGDHAEHGAELVRPVAERLGLLPSERQLLMFLVRHHLLLSTLSQRRDMGDLAMLRDVAVQVPSIEHLRGLYLLTYADLHALNESVWTEWKGALLWDAYINLSHIIEGDSGTRYERGAAEKVAQEAIRELSATFGRERVAAHLEGMPERYILSHEVGEIGRHLASIGELDPAPCATWLEAGDAYSTLTVCTRDQPYRLSQICGVISSADLNIIGARAYTRDDGVVLDLFEVTEADDDRPRVSSGHQREVRDRLRAVLAGEISVGRLLEQHRRRWSRRWSKPGTHPTLVTFEDSVSRQHTVIEISAADRQGLLYMMTHTLSDLGLDIHTARITTEVDKAVNAFYVTEVGEGRVVNESRRTEIHGRLVESIDGAG
jgi:[protein-PII] uridylyltransferase